MLKDFFSNRQNKLVVIAVSVTVAVTAVLIGFTMFFVDDEKNEADVSASAVISDSDKASAEDVAKRYVSLVGNFGVNDNYVQSADVISDVSLLTVDNPDGNDQIFVSRKGAYLKARGLVYDNSPAWFDGKAVSEWTNEIETRSMRSVSISDVQADADDKASIVDIDGTRQVNVRVTFTSTVKDRVQSANDSDWDGSYKVFEGKFADQSIIVSLIDKGGKWSVFTTRDVSNPVLLANWSNPELSIAFDRVHNLDEVGVLTRGGE